MASDHPGDVGIDRNDGGMLPGSRTGAVSSAVLCAKERWDERELEQGSPVSREWQEIEVRRDGYGRFRRQQTSAISDASERQKARGWIGLLRGVEKGEGNELRRCSGASFRDDLISGSCQA